MKKILKLVLCLSMMFICFGISKTDMISEVNAASYPAIDYAESAKAHRVRQEKGSAGCNIASMASIYALANNQDASTLYSQIKSYNGGSYWVSASTYSAYGFSPSSYTTQDAYLQALYTALQSGPCIVKKHFSGSYTSSGNHFCVCVGYNGPTDHLTVNGFRVMEVMSDNITSWYNNYNEMCAVPMDIWAAWDYYAPTNTNKGTGTLDYFINVYTNWAPKDTTGPTITDYNISVTYPNQISVTITATDSSGITQLGTNHWASGNDMTWEAVSNLSGTTVTQTITTTVTGGEGTYHTNLHAYDSLWNETAKELPLNYNGIYLGNVQNLGDSFTGCMYNSSLGTYVTDVNNSVVSKYKNNADNEYWKFIRQSDGTYLIMNVDTNKYMTYAGFNSNIYTSNYSGTDAQKWYILGSNNGQYRMASKAAYYVMDLYGGYSAENLNYTTIGSLDGGNQCFTIDKVDLTPGQASIKNLTAGVESFTVEASVPASSLNADGYVIHYAPVGSLLGPLTYTTETSKTFTGMSAGCKYYVEIRAYKDICGERCYGAWSEVLTVTPKCSSHTYESTTTKATLTKDGSIVNKCSVCGYEETTTIAHPSKFTLSYATTAYTGNAKNPSLTVTDTEGNVIASSNYTVTKDAGRIEVGTYYYTVKFKGNYSGTKKVKLTINPAQATIKSIGVGENTLTIKASATASSLGADGYEVIYRKTGTTTWTHVTNATTTIRLTELPTGTQYQVRMRAYKVVNGTTYYGAWSSINYTPKVR